MSAKTFRESPYKMSLMIATMGGLGYAPVASGTVGTVGAVAIAVSSGMAASGTLGGVTGTTGAAGGGVTGVGTLLNSGRSSPAGNIGVTGWGGFRLNVVAPNRTHHPKGDDDRKCQTARQRCRAVER